MSDGEVKEFDSPYNLLQDPSSLFYKMVQKTGPSASKKLQQMALDAHLARNSKLWTAKSGPYNYTIMQDLVQVLTAALWSLLIILFCCMTYAILSLHAVCDTKLLQIGKLSLAQQGTLQYIVSLCVNTDFVCRTFHVYKVIIRYHNIGLFVVFCRFAMCALHWNALWNALF